METEQLWTLARQARQLTDTIGLRLRDEHRSDKASAEYKRLSRVWHKALKRETRRFRVVNPPYTPQGRQ